MAFSNEDSAVGVFVQAWVVEHFSKWGDKCMYIKKTMEIFCGGVNWQLW